MSSNREKSSKFGAIFVVDKKITRIKLFYGVAFSLIALTLISSSLLVQRIASNNSSDSRRINIAGRQRMLSQRLVKCVLALHYFPSPAEQKPYLNEIESSLRSWRRAHQGLQRGDEGLGLPRQTTSPELLAYFKEMAPSHDAMVAALAFLLRRSQESGVDPALVRRTAATLLANEAGFLLLMDKITFRMDSEAKQRVTSLRTMEVVILLVGLSLLALEFLLVFRPSVLHLAKMMNAVTQQSVLLQQEIHERRKVEKLLQEEQEQLEGRVREEVTKNREKDLMLIQNDKMASLGQVAAGVAHEINNPMGYIAGNLSVLTSYFEQVVRYDRIIQEECLPALSLSLRRMVEQDRDTLKIEQILADGAELISETREGTSRITDIVRNLRSFSRMDQPEREPVQLHNCLESALIIVHNELKYVATAIRKEYRETPALLCHPGQLSQVFLNLLVNAGHAIAPAGEIILRCWCDADSVYASVSDTGSGIPDEIKERIMEPFFTTKEAGKGTGLGLSISHDIVKLHHGALLMESVVGRGTTFTVKLPRTLEWLGSGSS